MADSAYLLDAGLVPYREALELQQSLAAAVSRRAIPETVILVEHPAVITAGRRTGETEVHVPEEIVVEVIETNRGGKSTFHGPGQLVCYPILDLNRHGRDLKRYVRDLERVIIATVAPFGLEAMPIDGLTGVWLDAPPRKLASIGVHVSRWVTTHGFALNVDLDPAPFTSWITACGLEDAQFTTMSRELGRAVCRRGQAGCNRSVGRGVRTRVRHAAGRCRRRHLDATRAREARRALRSGVEP
jgi:lipoyl(octanoyl) transferase